MRIIDESLEKDRMTKATGLQPRTLELLPRSVVRRIMNESVHVKLLEMQTDKAFGKHLTWNLTADPLGKWDTRGCFYGMRSLEQWRTEDALLAHLEATPAVGREQGEFMRVERNVRLVDIDQESEMGVALCTVQDGAADAETLPPARTIRASYVLGADGGRSTVRSLMGIGFPGCTQNENFFTLHASFTQLPSGRETAASLIFQGTEGCVFSTPLPNDSHLVVCDLSQEQSRPWATGELEKRGREVLRQPTPEDILRLLIERGWGSEGTEIVPGSVQWCKHFKVNSRLATQFQRGRVFLCGDAAHCHSPLGAQGLNMGIGDVTNLCWKLELAVKGRLKTTTAVAGEAGEAGGPIDTVPQLLASYELERRRVDQQICHVLEFAAAEASSRSPVVVTARAMLSAAAARIPVMHALMRHVLSQRAWTYAGSPLSREVWQRSLPPAALFSKYVRDQRQLRRSTSRTRAGARIAAFDLPSGQPMYPYSHGWMLLLWEGDRQANEAATRVLSPAVPMRTVEELHAMAAALMARSGDLIDTIHVMPSGSPAEAKVGVRNQCLFLVRPDSHVAIRCEPPTEAAVMSYLSDAVGLNLPTSISQGSGESMPSSEDAGFLDADDGDAEGDVEGTLLAQIRAMDAGAGAAMKTAEVRTALSQLGSFTTDGADGEEVMRSLMDTLNAEQGGQ